MASTTSPHVLIIGGGLGGLVLAQALRKNGISFEIFERDPPSTVRIGWALGLHRYAIFSTYTVPRGVN
jgi:2-polyprenyl-6-methoxyphenol hydroxylase-like FAD-dependent oxidoreductase